jgi:hypothetical protein
LRLPRTILILSASAGVAAGLYGVAEAAAPTDPQAASQQPLQIMRVGEGLDHAARPLVDVPVLVADTGLDLDHPDLASRLLIPPPAGSDFAGQPNGCNYPANFTAVPDNDPSDPVGCSGHGTAVAGVLGAAWNNGAGGAGVAPNAKFIPFRTCYDSDQCFQYVQADAFNRAIDQYGARVVSMSWLSGGELEEDFANAIKSHPNTLFVTIPSGNGGATDAQPDAADRTPCSLNSANVLCVSTSSPTDGLSCGDYGATLVDLAVPTENSVTTANGGGFTPTGCATSYAAPAAAGLATILFGIAPEATGAQVRTAIIDGARKVGAWSGKSVSGGIGDAVGAVDALQAQLGITPGSPPGTPPPATDTTPPETTIVSGPDGQVGKKAKFKFASDDPAATFECALDRGSFSSCTSPKRVRRLDFGRHKFKVRAIDAAGNIDLSPAKIRFRASG